MLLLGGILCISILLHIEDLRKEFHKSYLFFPSTKLSTGCGNKIRFWLDPWVESQPFSSRFPRLYNLSSLKSSAILYFLSSSSNMNFHFYRNIKDSGIDELSSLLNLIQNFHLSPLSSDCRSWSLSASGLFSVSSFFSTLSNPSPPVSFPHK